MAGAAVVAVVVVGASTVWSASGSGATGAVWAARTARTRRERGNCSLVLGDLAIEQLVSRERFEVPARDGVGFGPQRGGTLLVGRARRPAGQRHCEERNGGDDRRARGDEHLWRD